MPRLPGIISTQELSVYHVALRTFARKALFVDGINVDPGVTSVLQHITEFSTQVHSGEWTGYTGKKITDTVNIGIDGSDLRPVIEALCF
jgi:glucose-6-phosphate isomerase